jgi:hypothetical protein
MGPLPAAGQWVQLQVPASRVGLEGSTLNGMAFTLFNGRATWDTAGRLNQTLKSGQVTNSTPVSITSMQMTASGMQLTWASVVGGVYQVAYKNGLTDATWTNTGAPITATGATTMWIDTSATSTSQRFYQLTKIN